MKCQLFLGYHGYQRNNSHHPATSGLRLFSRAHGSLDENNWKCQGDPNSILGTKFHYEVPVSEQFPGQSN